MWAERIALQLSRARKRRCPDDTIGLFVRFAPSIYCCRGRLWLTFAAYSLRLPPSGPIQNLVKITIACAIMSCGSRRRTPAAWVSRAAAYMIDLSRSAGIPSREEDEFASWVAVARGFDSCSRTRNGAISCVRYRELRGSRHGDGRFEGTQGNRQSDTLIGSHRSQTSEKRLQVPVFQLCCRGRKGKMRLANQAAVR